MQVLDAALGKTRWTFANVCTALFDLDGLQIASAIADTVDSGIGTAVVDITMTDPVAVGQTWVVDSANVDGTWTGAIGISDGSGVTT